MYAYKSTKRSQVLITISCFVLWDIVVSLFILEFYFYYAINIVSFLKSQNKLHKIK